MPRGTTSSLCLRSRDSLRIRKLSVFHNSNRSKTTSFGGDRPTSLRLELPWQCCTDVKWLTTSWGICKAPLLHHSAVIAPADTTFSWAFHNTTMIHQGAQPPHGRSRVRDYHHFVNRSGGTTSSWALRNTTKYNDGAPGGTTSSWTFQSTRLLIMVLPI